MRVVVEGVGGVMVCVCSLLFSNPLPLRAAAIFLQSTLTRPQLTGSQTGAPLSPPPQTAAPAKNEKKKKEKRERDVNATQTKEQRRRASTEKPIQITEPQAPPRTPRKACSK